ncbi:hypothetical protein E2C01_032506 [Portunus trituberculatus]|uniref:Uncharacterized protein n=1 Tax=Portunus trituberculatus TaxID=210409 RepID=A0A5B7F0G3_PORTR|nr:hypothetical protein [Portunus trituberculatus]
MGERGLGYSCRPDQRMLAGPRLPCVPSTLCSPTCNWMREYMRQKPGVPKRCEHRGTSPGISGSHYTP